MDAAETDSDLTPDYLADLKEKVRDLTLEHGKVMAGKDYVNGQPVFMDKRYVGDGEPGECWTNAWNAAGDYCEGLVMCANGYWGVHAWNLSPRGTVIEHTPHFQDATYYIGFVIDRTGALASGSRGWTGWRSSLLECMVAATSVEFTVNVLTGKLVPRSGRPNRQGRRTPQRRKKR